MDADQALLRQELAVRQKEYAPLLRRIAQEHAAHMERLKRHGEQPRQAQSEARVASRYVRGRRDRKRIVRHENADFFLRTGRKKCQSAQKRGQLVAVQAVRVCAHFYADAHFVYEVRKTAAEQACKRPKVPDTATTAAQA